MRYPRSVTLALLCLAASNVFAAQDVPAKNPLEGNADAIRGGMGLFRARCADCHGMDARGVRAPDITRVWASGRTDAGLFKTIKEGVAGTEMPANPRVQDAEAWQILAYLRTLAAPAPTDPPRGDAMNGERIFRANCAGCHRVKGASTIAPIVVKDKVIVAVAGGEFGIRGFIDAYEAQTGKRAWRFYTIPGPGEPGHETWAGDSWKIGGSGVWVTGAYDPEQNLLFYGTGNPGPDYHSESRLGDNLYSASLVAIDADTGKLRWHYQFTPHDVHDWDSTEVPVLGDITVAGQARKVVMFANRNGFYYTIDRTTGRVIAAKPFVTTTWAKEIGHDGRPVTQLGHTPDEKGEVTCPDITGGTNFWPPAFDPATRTFFVNAREACMTYYAWKPEYKSGDRFTGGAGQRGQVSGEEAYGALRAIDP